MDVEDLPFAVLDRDQTPEPRLRREPGRLALLSSSSPLTDYAANSTAACAAGEMSLALEIPPGFGRDLRAASPVEIGAWIDGAMPPRRDGAWLCAGHARSTG
jgi:ribosome-dependent ATPase